MGSGPRIATSGMIAAGFARTTSRAADPQLHTHLVVVNLVQGIDGRWSALDSRTLHRQATTASHLYQHLLRAELTRRLGVGWSEVQAPAQAPRGRAAQLAARVACLATRPAKRREEPQSQRQRWAGVMSGHVRATVNLDVIVDLEPAAAERAVRALEGLGLRPRVVLRPGAPGPRVDVFVSYPLDFETLVARASQRRWETGGFREPRRSTSSR